MTPIAEVIHNLLTTKDQIDLDLLEFAIELAATLIKAKKHLTEEKAQLLIPPLQIAIQTNQQSLVLKGLEGLGNIYECHNNLIPDVVSSGIIDLIISKMMDNNSDVNQAAHHAMMMITVTDHPEIIDHFIEVGGLQILI